MSAGAQLLCDLCGAASRFPGCHEVGFCSKEHAKLCGKPIDCYYITPLSEDEQGMIRQTVATPFSTADHVKSPSLRIHLKKVKLWDGDLDQLLSTLALPSDSHPLAEPRRSFLLCYVRNHLSRHVAERRPMQHLSPPGSSAFRQDSIARHMGMHIVHLLERCTTVADLADPANNVFRPLNEYLQRTTALFSLFIYIDPPPAPPALTYDLLDKALTRKAEAVEQAQVGVEDKRHMRVLQNGSASTVMRVKDFMRMTAGY
ncbi:hypothetical protein JCM10213_007214 [Rhodosporidiobolus nylandii]